MQGRFLLDIVITQRTAILQLFPGKDKTLLIRWNTFFVLNFRLHIINRIGWFDIQRDRFTGESFDKDLHSSAQTENKMKRRFLLDVIIAQRATVFQLFAGKNQTLLIRWNPFLVLNFRLDVVNRIRRFDVQRDGFAGEGFDENLMRSTKRTITRGEGTKGGKEIENTNR